MTTPQDLAVIAKAIAALEPFATFGLTEDDGDIRDGLMRDRVCDWLGPSEFGAARAALAALRALASAPAECNDDELLTIIARSIGRTTGVENYQQRARDVLDSIRSNNLSVPQPSKIAPADQSDAERETVIAEEDIEAVAKAMYKARHEGLSNCYPWDDTDLDHDHPDCRPLLYRDAKAAIKTIRALASAPSEAEEDAASPELMERHLEYGRESAKAQLASAPSEAVGREGKHLTNPQAVQPSAKPLVVSFSTETLPDKFFATATIIENGEERVLSESRTAVPGRLNANDVVWVLRNLAQKMEVRS